MNKAEFIKENLDDNGLYIVSFNCFELPIPLDAIEDCTMPGQDATPYVEHWHRMADWSRTTPEKIREELSHHSDWNLDDDQENRIKLFWIACWNASEEISMNTDEE